jgi:hypothetical protein
MSISRTLDFAILITVCMFVFIGAKSCTESVTLIDLKEFISLCESRGGTLVDSRCFKEEIKFTKEELR